VVDDAGEEAREQRSARQHSRSCMGRAEEECRPTEPQFAPTEPQFAPTDSQFVKDPQGAAPTEPQFAPTEPQFAPAEGTCAELQLLFLPLPPPPLPPPPSPPQKKRRRARAKAGGADEQQAVTKPLEAHAELSRKRRSKLAGGGAGRDRGGEVDALVPLSQGSKEAWEECLRRCA
jgi:hypothetical protein